MGALIGQHLHLSVFPYSWWADKFKEYRILWSDQDATNAVFYVKKEI